MSCAHRVPHWGMWMPPASPGASWPGRSGDELLTGHRLLRTQVNADAHKLGRPDNTYPRAFLHHDATMTDDTDDLSITVLVDVFTAMFIAARSENFSLVNF